MSREVLVNFDGEFLRQSIVLLVAAQFQDLDSVLWA